MAGQGRAATPVVTAAEVAAREQDTEVLESACNGLRIPEVACNGLTVHDGACNGLTAQDGACNEVTPQEGSAIAGRAGAEGTLFRALQAEEVRRQGHRMVELIADYLQGVGDISVCSSMQPLASPSYLSSLPLPLSLHASYFPTPRLRILPLCFLHRAALHGRHIQRHLTRHNTLAESPCFFAFFSSPTSAAAIGADALISALNVVGFS
ncbi:unnamed protein product [Closterium sp. NIES-54]